MSMIRVMLGLGLFVCLCLPPQPGLAQSTEQITAQARDQAALVRDINSVVHIVGSKPRQLFRFGTRVGFTVENDHRVWLSDGTAAGTAPVQMNGLPVGVELRDFVSVGERFFFIATDEATYVRQLWVSDGTTAGSRQLIPSQAAAGMTAPAHLLPLGTDGVLFIGNIDTGYGLWVHDGTADGLRLLLPNITHIGVSTVVANGKTWLFGGPDFHSMFLITTDGTTAGTSVLKQVTFDEEEENDVFSNYDFSAVHQGKVFFYVDKFERTFWESDGTAAGTKPREEPDFITSELASTGSMLFQLGSTSVEQRQLRANGSAIFQIPEQYGNSSGLTVVGSKIFFTLENASQQRELWVSDGTAAGTKKVATSHTGATVLEARIEAASSQHLFFTASDNQNPRSLWRTDGTAAGTVRLGAVAARSIAESDVVIRWPVAVGAQLFFHYDDQKQYGEELWVSNGTANGTRLVRDIYTSSVTESASPFGLTQLGTKLFFFANDGVHGFEPWVSDGTAAGTQMIRELIEGSAPELADPRARLIATLNEQVFFTARPDKSTTITELWVSDGTAAGTSKLRTFDRIDIALVPLGDTLFIAAGGMLWQSNGTVAGTKLAYDFGAADIRWMQQHGTKLWIAAGGYFVHGSAGTSLWSYTPGTSLPQRFVDDAPMITEPVFLQDKLYFAQEINNSDGLWVSDGTTAAPKFVQPFTKIHRVVATEDRLFLEATKDGKTGLWSSNGVAGNATLLAALPNVVDFRVRGKYLFFTQPLAGRGYICVSDGSQRGTRCLIDQGYDYTVQQVGDVFAILVQDRDYQTTLWKFDGNLLYVVQGFLSKTPELYPGLELGQVGEKLFFSARTNATGHELYAINAAMQAPPIEPRAYLPLVSNK